MEKNERGMDINMDAVCTRSRYILSSLGYIQ